MKFTPLTEKDRQEMLESMGYKSIEDLFSDIPESIRNKANLNIQGGMSEYELRKHVRQLAANNKNLDQCLSFLGAGTYDHYIPSFVNQLLLRSEFYTAYTPYQPEISQGTLQSIFEYQSFICELTGMDASNASVYDGATATAEAANMAAAVTRRKKVLYSGGLHPEYVQVLKTYTWAQGIEIEEIDLVNGVTSLEDAQGKVNTDVACIIVQYPNFFGLIENLESLAEVAHSKKALFVVVNPELVALGILKPPGKLGADIVVGDAHSFGNHTAFGGPHVGYMATTQKHVRRLPGRIVGKTTDVDGKVGYVLTLQAREQHIRREKASSNICSNQALNALAVTMTLSALGKEGLRKMAEANLQNAHYAFKKITALNQVEAAFDNRYFFNEFVVKLPSDASAVVEKLSQENILPGVALGKFDKKLSDHLLVCVTELKTKADIDLLVEKLGGAL